MAYLEELLFDFRKGDKIRRKDWVDGGYLVFDINNELIIDETGIFCEFIHGDIISDEWELYQEPIDWDYIVKNKCLCWFWEGEKDNNAYIGCLAGVYNEKYNSFRSSEGTRWNHCLPLRRDEVTFYEDKKDENNL